METFSWIGKSFHLFEMLPVIPRVGRRRKRNKTRTESIPDMVRKVAESYN